MLEVKFGDSPVIVMKVTSSRYLIRYLIMTKNNLLRALFFFGS